jgi:hypothetical protein
MWNQMLVRTEGFKADRQDLGRLTDDLRGLFVEADPHDMTIRSEFESYWSPIEGENELRTESWAPPGSASDANLDSALEAFSGWVRNLLASDSTETHS